MKLGPPHAQTRPAWESALGNQLVIDVTNPPERPRRHPVHVHTELTEHLGSVGHQTFAAGLVDGRPGRIQNHYLEALDAAADGRGQPSRAAAYNHEIRNGHGPSAPLPRPWRSGASPQQYERE